MTEPLKPSEVWPQLDLEKVRAEFAEHRDNWALALLRPSVIYLNQADYAALMGLDDE